ncbi:MAG: hypothetical protein ACRDMJ_15390 [Solirubrobacteraceae bacterium]
MDDPLLQRVRAARPTLAPDGELPATVAGEVLNATLAQTPTRPRRLRTQLSARVLRSAVPIMGAGVAIAVMVAAILVLGHRAAAPTPAISGGQPLTASEYAIALGADTTTANPAAGTTNKLLFDAEQRLRARCMAQRGLTYRIETFPRPGPLPSDTGYPTTFYPSPAPAPYPEATLLAVRAHHGFGIFDDATAPHRNPDPEDRYVSTLNPGQRSRWLAAWRGPNGCLSLAGSQLYGSRHAAAMFAAVPTLIYDYIDSIIYTRSGAISPGNRPTAAAARAWSRCMQSSTGHSFSDEDALVAWLLNSNTPRQQHTRTFRQLEIRYALQDTRCAYRVGQPRTFTTAFHTAANHLPSKLATQLRYVLDHQTGWVNRARRILRSRP